MYKNIYNKIKCNFNLSLNKGLTLVELLVVIAIFLVITGSIMFDYNGFRSSVSLQNLTDDIALSIRKAQGFAIGARGVNNNFSNGYGVHFSINSSVGSLAASNKSFLMFKWDPSVSSTKKYIYNQIGNCGDSSSNNCIEAFGITTVDFIKGITIDVVSKVSPAYLDIVFVRPDPRAYFCYRTNVNNDCDSTNISSVGITISNGQATPNEKTKTIFVQNTGQISINNS